MKERLRPRCSRFSTRPWRLYEGGEGETGQGIVGLVGLTPKYVLAVKLHILFCWAQIG